MEPHLRPFIKGLVQLTLLVILLKYFGLQSWQRFKEEKTVVTSAEKNLGEISAPSVTVCVENPKTQMGYKDDFLESELASSSGIIGQICQGLQGEDIVRCLEEKTYNISTVVKQASKGVSGGTNRTDTRFWNADFSSASEGMCYQLEANMTLGTDQETDVLLISLNSALFSWVWIHDPKFFLTNSNPGLPFTLTSIKSMKWYSFRQVLHKNLDVASKRCNPDPLYSFTGCIKTSLSWEVGCRLHWDRWTDRQLPECDKLEQYRYCSECLNQSKCLTKIRETVPLLTSDMGKKTVSVLAH